MKKTLLSLSFSPRVASTSAALADGFIADWHKANPDAELRQRALGREVIAGPDEAWIAANMTPEAERTPEQVQRLAASDQAIADLHAASHIVIATPMFNFGLPWTLKSYVDLIIRVGKTFSFDPATGFGPLLSADKKLMIVWSSAGEYQPGTPTAPFDHLTPYLRQVFGFMGVTQSDAVSAGNMWGGPDAAAASLASARAQLAALSPSW